MIGGRDGVAERKMFGGIGWMVSGNLACGMMGDSLLGRLDRDDTGAGLRGVAGTKITVRLTRADIERAPLFAQCGSPNRATPFPPLGH